MSLGTTLRRVRVAQQLSQQQVADGLCAQSMLSAVENDRYVPNAKLLLALCRRLKISVDQFSLADDFDISSSQAFNAELSRLCNDHQYVALKAFLLQPSTIERVLTDQQTQAYYYYLGVAEMHVDADWDQAQHNLNFAIHLTGTRSVLTRLALAALAVIKAKLGYPKTANELVRESLTNIETVPYQADLNVVYFLSALVAYTLQENDLAGQRLAAGITYITAHQSPYMLANSYRLLAQIAARQGRSTDQQTALAQQRFLSQLFHEKISSDF